MPTARHRVESQHVDELIRDADGCERCGAPPRVLILHGYSDGHPEHARFCLACADQVDDESRRAGESYRPRLPYSQALVLGGTAIGLVALAWDELAAGEHLSFAAAAGLGVTLIGMGAFFRIDLIGVIGTVLLLCAGAILAIGSGSVGHGWKQWAGMAVGGLLAAAGMVRGLWRWRRRAAEPEGVR